MTQDIGRTKTKLTAEEIKDLLGPPPVLDCENRQHYDQLYSGVADALAAGGDVILAILAKRFTDATWESSRYTRHRTVMIDRRVSKSLEFQAERKKKQKERRDEALERIASELGQPTDEFAQMMELEGIIVSTVDDVDGLLDRVPAEIEHNRALEKTILEQGQFEALIDSATRRQDNALELAARYRSLKREFNAPDEIIDVDYKEIDQAPEQVAAPPLVSSKERAPSPKLPLSGEPFKKRTASDEAN